MNSQDGKSFFLIFIVISFGPVGCHQVVSFEFGLYLYLYFIVRDDILRRWEPRQQSHIIEFVSLWRGELPSSIWTNVEDQLILPKLTQAVSEWDPINERILISEWLLPWHNILGKTKMYDMVTQIRQRFRQCLRRWETSDNSAKVILTPWKNVWSEVEWNQFMLQNIVPKLEATMSNIVINISTVDTTSIGHIQDWIGLIPSQAMLKIFDEIFYRKWSAAIQAWLKSPNVSAVFGYVSMKLFSV